MIAGLEDISAGSMYIDDTYVNDDTPSERGIGMVFQSYALYPHMSVYQNMAFGLNWLVNQRRDRCKVQNSARILQLGTFVAASPERSPVASASVLQWSRHCPRAKIVPV